MKLENVLKELEVNYGWSFYDEKGKLCLEDMQKELLQDTIKAVKNLCISDVSQRSELLAIAALDKIAHPIKYLQSEAKKDGAKLDGCMAMQITQDVNFYRGIADKALKAIANCG